MAFEGLTSRLQNVFGKLRGKGKVTEDDVNEAMREVRLALLEADVNFKVVKDFIAKVKEHAIGLEVMKSFTPGMVVVDIVNKELTELMGGTQTKLAKANKPPTVILMAGLQGAGKTTTSGKLAKLAASSTIISRCSWPAIFIGRPRSSSCKCSASRSTFRSLRLAIKSSPVEIAKQGLQHAKDNGHDYVIIDTAGRLHIDEALMDEIKQYSRSGRSPTKCCSSSTR